MAKVEIAIVRCQNANYTAVRLSAWSSTGAIMEAATRIPLHETPEAAIAAVQEWYPGIYSEDEGRTEELRAQLYELGRPKDFIVYSTFTDEVSA